MCAAGHALRLQRFRKNEECGVVEELSAIDENPHYDFDYQVYIMSGKTYVDSSYT